MSDAQADASVPDISVIESSELGTSLLDTTVLDSTVLDPSASIPDVATIVPARDEPFLAVISDVDVMAETSVATDSPADVNVIATRGSRDRAALRVEPEADDLPRAAPASRREARASRSDAAAEPTPGRRSSHSDATTGREFVPTVTIPIVAPPKTSPAAQAAGTRRGSRHIAAKGMAGLVMGVVALLAVATSTPANALLSAADVQAAAVTAQSAATGPAQTMSVSDDVGAIAVQRDGYDTATVAQVAANSGIRLEATFTNNPNGTVQWPFLVGVHIGDRYGSRDCAGCSSDHHGQDFNPGLGASIQAIADGVVSYAEDGDGDLGVHMMIDHVINGEVVTSVYAHMIHGSMNFKVGDHVKVGDIVGKTGDTGMSTGPHLHFEIRLGGKDGPWTDPLVWLYANTN
ncbi:MAG: M23 family metallopeptidase [Leifsonia sp.]